MFLGAASMFFYLLASFSPWQTIAGSPFRNSSSSSGTTVRGDIDDSAAFAAWLARHNKTYTLDDSYYDYNQRFQIWQTNRDTVERHNQAYERGETLYAMTLDASPFADRTDAEFAASHLMQPSSLQRHCADYDTNGVAFDAQKNVAALRRRLLRTAGHTTTSIDWRTQGVLTPVKNQGHCGSCWSFSTTATVEAHTCILHDRDDCATWTGLSEQQLVDCSSALFPNATSGCQGGWPSVAMEYIKYAGGIDEEEVYPYRGEENPTCLLSNSSSAWTTSAHSSMARGVQVVDVFNITYQDEDEVELVVTTMGPVSVNFQVSPDFRFYSHGIYDAYNATTNQTMCHGEEQFLNHAVVIVGMDTTTAAAANTAGDDDGTPYYIIRNSWGTTWGMEGHFAMLRGVNLCGISDCASFPILARRRPSSHQQQRPLEPAATSNTQRSHTPLVRRDASVAAR